LRKLLEARFGAAIFRTAQSRVVVIRGTSRATDFDKVALVLCVQWQQFGGLVQKLISAKLGPAILHRKTCGETPQRRKSADATQHLHFGVHNREDSKWITIKPLNKTIRKSA
jgi:hypothetical protein